MIFIRNFKQMRINTIAIIGLFIIFPHIFTMASVFVTHGGGPFPLIQKEQHVQFHRYLKQIGQQFPNPKAIILFSAHWQENDWTMIDYDNPPLYYDYYGFPPETYNLTYPISSTTEIRNHIKSQLLKEGVAIKSNTKRGYDHGVFIPLMIAYPKANIPVIEMSILKSLDPEAHFRMGQAIRGLKKQGYLIIGSGSSVHGGYDHQQKSKLFDTQLSQKWIDTQYHQQKLLYNIKNWKSLSNAKLFHPREEHLVPIFINLGAYEGKSKKNQKYVIMGVHCSNFILQ